MFNFVAGAGVAPTRPDESGLVLKPVGFNNFPHGKTSFPDPFLSGSPPVSSQNFTMFNFVAGAGVEPTRPDESGLVLKPVGFNNFPHGKTNFSGPPLSGFLSVSLPNF